MGFHHRPMPALRRINIEDEIESHLRRVELLVARLDRADAPFEDLEDDDPGGDALDKGEGEGHFGQGLLPDRPRYGVDQTRAPLNHAVAERDHHARSMGMMRSARGGWRYAN